MSTLLIKNSIEKGLSYASYRNLVKQLLSKNKSTGPQQSDTLLEYSKLNDKRMDRLDKTITLAEEIENELQKLHSSVTFLVIAEGWCGDAAQILPVINKIAEASEKITLKIVLRDENEELMNQFLTNGSKSIPKLIIADSSFNVINTWGPRPSIATKMVQDYKAEKGSLDAEFKKNLQLWYNKDKGLNTQKDIIGLI